MVEKILFVISLGLWTGSFIYSLVFYLRSKDNLFDSIYINYSKSFEEAKKKLNLLEKVIKEDLSGVKKKLSKYEENAQRTKRKYSHYSHYIEPALVRLYINARDKEVPISRCIWRVLDYPMKAHVIVLCIASTVAFSSFLFFLYSVLGPIGLVILGIISTAFFIVAFFVILRLNFVIFYLIVDGLLILFKKQRGKLSKNVKFFNALSARRTYGHSGGMVIAAAGVSSFGGGGFSGGGGGSFGGFGGGSFGGGGAGGSW